MKKILKVLIILIIFYITITIFIAIDSHIMTIRYANEPDDGNCPECGLGFALLPVISKWKYTFLMIILAIWAKCSKKLDAATKNTIYFLPILSIWSFLIIGEPLLWLMNLLWK